MPDDIRRYAGKGRDAVFRSMALSMNRVEEERALRAKQEAAPALPQLDPTARTFVKKYVDLGASWGCGERAALMAGYGKISAYQGGRSAAVRACVLLKKPVIQKAIREYQDMLYRSEQLQAEKEHRAGQRALLDSMIANLKKFVQADKPQSKAAQVLRRLTGQPVKRMPGYCVCGDKATEGYASCEPCRVKHRHYRQSERAAKRQRPGLYYGQ